MCNEQKKGAKPPWLFSGDLPGMEKLPSYIILAHLIGDRQKFRNSRTFEWVDSGIWRMWAPLKCLTALETRVLPSRDPTMFGKPNGVI